MVFDLFKKSKFSLSNHDRLLLTFELRVAEHTIRYKTVQQQHVHFFWPLGTGGSWRPQQLWRQLVRFFKQDYYFIACSCGKTYDLLLAVMQQQLDGAGGDVGKGD